MAKRDGGNRRGSRRRHLSPVPDAESAGDTDIRNRFDRIHGSRIHNLKELRPRVVFDPDREAIVLAAGNKAGRWSAWYTEAIPLAEARYAAYRQAADEEEE